MEAAKERRNSAERLIWASETRILVTDVPILAPITMGMALVIFITPLPTIPTTIDVVEEELCIIEVAKIPIKRPTKGLEVVLIKDSANPLPNIFRDAPIKSMLNKNKYKKNNRMKVRNSKDCLTVSLIDIRYNSNSNFYTIYFTDLSVKIKTDLI